MIIFEYISQLLIKHYSEALAYLIVINLLAFGLFGYDKYKAMLRMRRIPESTLIFLGFAGGALGAYLSMRIFRHKTRKPKFYIFIPLFLLLQLAFLGLTAAAYFNYL